MRRLVVILGVLLFAVPAYAGGHRTRCQAISLGRRTLATVELHRFFDRELLRLIRLGLKGDIRVQLTLMRSRTAWFDDVVARVTHHASVTWDQRTRRYLLDGVPIDSGDLSPLRLARVPLGRQRRSTAKSHYVEVNVRLQVVTVSSLLTAAGWITGDKGRPDQISTTVARAVTVDLLRKASSSCTVRKGN